MITKPCYGLMMVSKVVISQSKSVRTQAPVSILQEFHSISLHDTTAAAYEGHMI